MAAACVVGAAVPCCSSRSAQRPALRTAPQQRPQAVNAGARRRHACRAMSQDTSVPGAGLKPELREAIQQFIDENKVVAFIKGTKQFPQCGFSNTVVQILNSTGVNYVTVNVLEDELLRSGMKEFSAWPTFPQVYIGGEFFGGADIMIQAYTSGELAETLEAAVNS